MARFLARVRARLRRGFRPLRLRNLERRYRRFGGPATERPVWSAPFVETIDLGRFRDHGAYVWQAGGANLDEAALDAAYAYARSHDRLGLLGRLDEDGAFGARVFRRDGRFVSRDLLDSVNELDFLDRHLGLGDGRARSVLDVGAGYGRLAHRACVAFPTVRWSSTDAVARSTFLAERYLAFRGLERRAPVIPLDALDAALANERFDLAVNVHSFSECTEAAIAWWLGRLAGAGVPALFLVPNAVGPGGEPLTNAGASMAPLLAAAGFRLDVTEPKYRDAATQAAGLSPTAYLLYRR